MSTSLDNLDPLETGEKVLEAAVAFAEEEWQGRLIAAFALGSLAHGGFSVNASDIDLGLVLNDPLVVDFRSSHEFMQPAGFAAFVLPIPAL